MFSHLSATDTRMKRKEFPSTNSITEWPRTQPPRNVEIYRELYWKEPGTGDHTRESSDMDCSDKEDEPELLLKLRPRQAEAADFSSGLEDTGSVFGDEVLAGPAVWSTTVSRPSSLRRGRRAKPEDPLVTLERAIVSAVCKRSVDDYLERSREGKMRLEAEVAEILKARTAFC